MSPVIPFSSNINTVNSLYPSRIEQSCLTPVAKPRSNEEIKQEEIKQEEIKQEEIKQEEIKQRDRTKNQTKKHELLAKQ